VFSEPLPPLYTVDCEYDIMMMGPVKAIPGKFSCWDKTHLKGPLTLGQIVKHYKDEYNVEISMISFENIVLLNTWMMNPKVQ